MGTLNVPVRVSVRGWFMGTDLLLACIAGIGGSETLGTEPVLHEFTVLGRIISELDPCIALEDQKSSINQRVKILLKGTTLFRSINDFAVAALYPIVEVHCFPVQRSENKV